MEVVIKRDPAECCRLAAKVFQKVVEINPEAVLGLATGRTPEPMYAELVQLHKKEGLNFSKVTTFNLDEYVGLSAHHPASYAYYMNDKLFRHVGIKPDQVHIPDGTANDIPKVCAEYEACIRNHGGIDVQLLGLGGDGHIGFNEPSSSLASRTRIKTLTKKTVEANKVYFKEGEKMPRHVITMGIGTIMEARKCVLLAYGESKVDAVAQMIEGPVTSMVPASILQMHPSVVVIIDEAASAKLKHSEYYRYVYQSKPEWQQYE